VSRRDAHAQHGRPSLAERSWREAAVGGSTRWPLLSSGSQVESCRGHPQEAASEAESQPRQRRADYFQRGSPDSSVPVLAAGNRRPVRPARPLSSTMIVPACNSCGHRRGPKRQAPSSAGSSVTCSRTCSPAGQAPPAGWGAPRRWPTMPCSGPDASSPARSDGKRHELKTEGTRRPPRQAVRAAQPLPAS
jgi:hypothetical protein